MKRFYLFIILGLLAITCGTQAILTPKTINNNNTVYSSSEDTTSYKTLVDLPSPLVAGPTPKSYYDDGVLYYVHTADTIGYNVEHKDVGFEFDLKFTALNSSSWLSLTLKASGCDRTQSGNLSQKGYSVLIFNHGLIQLLKNGSVEYTTNISAIELNRKYNIKIFAKNSGSNVNVGLLINNSQVIAYEDLTSPYLDGAWFNICSDGGVSAELYSTKKEYIPNYETYTLATIGNDILTSNNAKVDVNKNIELVGSAGAVGIFNYYKNFSLEFCANFSTFASYNNFWISWRSSNFDRASTTSASRGYATRICQSGVVEIYKNETLVISGYFEPFEENKNYTIEIGAVDYNAQKTNVFVNINNQKVSSYIDQTNPIQNYGFICINNDGNVSCKLSSSSSKLIPLSHTVTNSTAETIVDIYFYNVLSYKNMTYADFSTRLLKAILINDNTIFDLNTLYTTSSGKRAVDLNFEGNKLTITISKSVINSLGAVETLQATNVELKKTTAASGFITETGFTLAQNYIFEI